MMSLEVSTPALLFPAISLLFLSYTNRFLHLAALIRTLHKDWKSNHDAALKAQIDNLRRRLHLIRSMQLFGAVSLLLCVVSMVTIILGSGQVGAICFFAALCLMGISLAALVAEILLSGGALHIMLNRMEDE